MRVWEEGVLSLLCLTNVSSFISAVSSSAQADEGPAPRPPRGTAPCPEDWTQCQAQHHAWAS